MPWYILLPSDDLTVSVKHARMQEKASKRRSTSVRMRVTESQAPFFVNTGIRIWKAKRVPDGSSFAKLAVPASAPDSARVDKEDEEEELLISCVSFDDVPSAIAPERAVLSSASVDCLSDRRCLTDMLRKAGCGYYDWFMHKGMDHLLFIFIY